jgi:K+-sensing histidine kinase KdpD
VRVFVEHEATDTCVAVRTLGPELTLDELERAYTRPPRGQDPASRNFHVGLYVAHRLLALHGGALRVRLATDAPAGVILCLCLPR